MLNGPSDFDLKTFESQASPFSRTMRQRQRSGRSRERSRHPCLPVFHPPSTFPNYLIQPKIIINPSVDCVSPRSSRNITTHAARTFSSRVSIRRGRWMRVVIGCGNPFHATWDEPHPAAPMRVGPGIPRGALFDLAGLPWN